MSDALLTITSQTGAIDLVLTTTSVRMQLAGKVLDEVHAELASADKEAQAQESAWAARFAHFITRSVGKLVSKSIEVPISDISSVEYAGSALVFHYVKKPLISFETASVGEGKQHVPVLQTFSESDARVRGAVRPGKSSPGAVEGRSAVIRAPDRPPTRRSPSGGRGSAAHPGAR